MFVLFSVAAVLITTAVLATCFTIFDELANSTKKQNSIDMEKGQSLKNPKNRNVENMQGLPMNKTSSVNNLKSISQPVEITHKREERKTRAK